MGRRAVYFTVAAKKAAKRAQAQSYRLSAKGKATKSRANRRYYERQKDVREKERTSLASLDVEIPSDLIARAERTLRPCLAIAATEYGPSLWPPPRYRFFLPPTSMLDSMPWPPESGPWETRAAVLASYEWWEMIARGRARTARWMAQPTAALHGEVSVEVFKRVAGWTELRDTILDVEEEEAYVREVALDWGARLICLLVEEWECRAKDGLQAYEDAGKGKQLPWQRFVTQTERLYRSEAEY